MELNTFLSRLNGVKRAGGEYMAQCPCHGHAHGDKQQSLSIKEDGGKILVYCHTGHTAEQIVEAMGLNMADLRIDQQQQDRREQFIDWYAGQNGLTRQEIYSYEYGNFRDGLAKIRFIKKNGKKTFRWIKNYGASKSGYKLTHDGCPHRLFVAGNIAKAEAVYLVEGEKDALTMARITDTTAVSAENGATEGDAGGKWLDEYTEQLRGKTVYILSDNDEAGRHFATVEAEALRSVATVYNVNIFSEWADAPEKADISDMVKAFGEETAKKMLAAAIEKTPQEESEDAPAPDNVADYINRLMGGEIERFKEGASRKTGFDNLDAVAGGVYPGLYVLGAISSLGKTTFIHQMADQMAAAGEHVLFFSLEQSRLEMVSKSLARITAQRDINTAVNSLSIRGGYLPRQVKEAARGYTEAVGERLSVIEGNFSCNVEYIVNYTRQYSKRNGVKPIVIVDYLQILQGDPNQRQNTKDQVDTNITEIKRMSRDLDIPVFLISSLNRSNYMTPVDFESFKESGGIEYTADVIWGLQLHCLNEDIFNSDQKTKIKEKREKIREAKDATPRKIELQCLKNRYGRMYRAAFDYYPQFDLFIPGKQEDTRPAKRY